MKRSIRNLTKILPDCFKREIERGGGKVLHLADVRVKRLFLYIYIPVNNNRTTSLQTDSKKDDHERVEEGGGSSPFEAG